MGVQGENWIQRHQLTVEQYYQMAQAGVLSPDDRVELIEGEIIDMAPIGSEHASIVRTLAGLFNQTLQGRAIVAVQDPLTLNDRSQPEPDVALLHPRVDRYRYAHPRATDVYLIVEVAQTSLRYDREIKLPLYAKSGIPEVWIVDTEARNVTVYRQPEGARYRSEATVASRDKLAPSTFLDAQVDLFTLLQS